jgi:hypothetical protein
MRSSWINISLLNFLVATLMGLSLRYAFIGEIGWLDYRNMLHAHSHVAMLGWVYLILFALLVGSFVSKGKQESPFYNKLFWATQVSVFGMMVSFPIQGYGAVSITFSTMHIIASYVFAWKIWKDLPRINTQGTLLVKLGLVSMVFSTIGIWAMGPVMALDLRNTPLYHLVVQFYLHFQFNGWFVLAVLALLLKVFKSWNVEVKQGPFMQFVWIYSISLLFTFFHVMHWAYPHPIYFIFNGIGVVLQVVAFTVLFWPIGRTLWKSLKVQDSVIKLLFAFGMASLLFKIIFQAGLVVPEVSEISTTIRQFMIGYIHLTMLGFITGAILLALAPKVQFSTDGIAIFITGYVGTELLLFVQGIFFWARWGSLPYYHEVLFIASLMIPVGIVLIMLRMSVLNQIRKYNHINT